MSIIDLIIDSGNIAKNVPGLQTLPYLFELQEFFKLKQSFILSCSSYLNKNLDIKSLECWCHVNFYDFHKNEDREKLWHHHGSQSSYDLSGLYYLKVPSNIWTKNKSGTEFKDDKIKNIIPEDFCWFIYPSNLLHRPGLIKSNERRYVIAADIKYNI